MREFVVKIAVVSAGPDWSSDLAGVFGRSPYILFFDTETGTTQSFPNPGAESTGGSGTEAAQFVLNQGAEVLVAPKVGPKAHRVLEAAGMRFLFRKDGTSGAALAEARKEAPA